MNKRLITTISILTSAAGSVLIHSLRNAAQERAERNAYQTKRRAQKKEINAEMNALWKDMENLIQHRAPYAKLTVERRDYHYQILKGQIQSLVDRAAAL